MSPLAALAKGERVAERDFDRLFPRDARKFSRTHWTPLAAAVRAAALLAPQTGARVLDVGAGAGKLCIVGAVTTGGVYTGIEREEDAAAIAQALIKEQRIQRCRIVCGDALAADWSAYDALYFFNPFSNHVEDEAEFVRIIATVTAKLAALPSGKRVVTFHGFGGTMPPAFRQEHAEVIGPGVLQLWVN